MKNKTSKIINIILSNIFGLLFRILPIQNNKIMFFNFFGNGYGCNSKYICEYILKNNLNFKLIWAVNSDKYVFPSAITPVKIGTLRYYYHLSTSKIIFDNQHRKFDLMKRKRQFFIKTWHATLGLKKIGLDNPERKKISSNWALKYNNKITDLMISNCPYVTAKFRRVFNYTGEIYECGFPRTDLFFGDNKAKREEIERKIGVNSEHYILYAPTFRTGNSMDFYDLDLKAILDLLPQIIPGDWKAIVKLHPNIKKSELLYDSPNVINANEYDDIQELLLISDILITDYSNIMFEFSIMQKPVFLYIKDKQKYDESRGFYFDIDDLPFYSATTNNELIELIKGFNKESYDKRLALFYETIGFREKDNSSELLVKKIQTMMEG